MDKRCARYLGDGFPSYEEGIILGNEEHCILAKDNSIDNERVPHTEDVLWKNGRLPRRRYGFMPTEGYRRFSGRKLYFQEAMNISP